MNLGEVVHHRLEVSRAEIRTAKTTRKPQGHAIRRLGAHLASALFLRDPTGDPYESYDWRRRAAARGRAGACVRSSRHRRQCSTNQRNREHTDAELLD